MPGCNIVGCGARKRKNQRNLTFHRLPRNEVKKKKWLDIIGIENIKPKTKEIYVCSLHFEENAFNRTLEIVKLRDDAIPSRHLLPSSYPENQTVLKERQLSVDDQRASTMFFPTASNVSETHYSEAASQYLMEPAPSSTSDFMVKPSSYPENQDVLKERQLSVDEQCASTMFFPTASNVSETHYSEAASQYLMEPAPSSTSDFMVKDQPAVIIKKLEKKCEKQKKKIKCLNEKVRRQKKKICNFRNIIKDLKARNLLSNDSTIIIDELEGPKDFLKRQILKSKGLPQERKYAEETRKFALTLHFFSPKAYDFVRRTYNTCLPHPRTLSRWYQTVNAEPGFCSEAFQTLKTKVQSSDKPVICALALDEMAIRKSLCWDPQTKTYYGRVNTGIDCDSDSLEVASQCLVLLITSINGSWKLPLGYFFITSLTGEQKSFLIETAIKKCEEVGVKIVSLTCDGPAANFSMLSHLGCDLVSNQDVTSFKCSESFIHVFIDPCHAIKLIRNTFGELKILYDTFGRKIDFIYLERLLRLQETEGLHMATKITKAHLMFDKQKMKVRLATQLLSNSVADALAFCENHLKIKDFEGCAGTINFIRLLNDVFDVLNSRSIRPPGWKKAICPENIGMVETLFEGAIGYLQNLKLVSGELVIKSKRRTGFIGLIIDMKSAICLYRHLIEDTKLLKYIPLYKVSQDHIELFFSSIRARGGYNNNPNAVQFKAAFKKLLIRAEIREGGLGNCIPLEQINILTCSSRTNPVTTINDLTEKKVFVEIPEDDSNLYDEFMNCLDINLSEYSESITKYIAGFVARKLCRSIKCEDCILLLVGSETQNMCLITLKNRGGLTYASKDTEEIIKNTEKILKLNFQKEVPENYYLYIFKFLMENFGDNNIFKSNAEHDIQHKHLLMKSVVQTYMHLRFKYFGKKTTEIISLRNYLNKIVLFRNE